MKESWEQGDWARRDHQRMGAGKWDLDKEGQDPEVTPGLGG